MKRKSHHAWEVWSRGDRYNEPGFVEAFKDKGEAERRIRRLRLSHPHVHYMLKHRRVAAHHQFGSRAHTRAHARDLFGSSRRPPVRIRKSRRRKVSREIDTLIRHGYSPRYAAQVAYHPRAHRGHRDKLTAAQRRRLPAREYALPARRALPIEDPRHIRNAAARLEQMRRRGTVTKSEYLHALRRIRRAEKAHGIRHRVKSRRRDYR
jgi:hypothetical protein